MKQNIKAYLMIIFFSRLRSKCYLIFIGLAVLVALIISSISLYIIFSENNVNNEISDPEFPLPPSSMPMGLYSKVGVVSNGGPCSQIGV